MQRLMFVAIVRGLSCVTGVVLKIILVLDVALIKIILCNEFQLCWKMGLNYNCSTFGS